MDTVPRALPAPTAWTEYHLAVQDLTEVEAAYRAVRITDPRWPGLHGAWRCAMKKADAAFDVAMGWMK